MREPEANLCFRPLCYTPGSAMTRRSLFVVALVSGFAALLYAAQVFTPLRLTTDGIYYLSFADSAARGDGVADLYRQHFLLPKGYPAILFVLMKAGVFSSLALVTTNLIFFSVGLLLNFQTLVSLGFERRYSAVLCLLTILSFVSIKNITLPMSDFLFYALSATTWWLMNLQGGLKWLAIVPSLCAVEVRLAGLALFVPLAFLAWSSASKRPRLLVPALVGLAGFLGIGIWSGRRYFGDFLKYVRETEIFRLAARALVFHCRDFGELTANVPLAKLPRLANPFFLTAGALALLLFVAGTFLLRKRSPLIFFYLFGYGVLILPWPFTDPRFWLPAMPLVLVAIHQALAAPRWHVPKMVFVTYVMVFCTLGFAALGYSTWLTFSGSKFPYRYGDGKLRATYLARCSAGGSEVNPEAAELLKRYEWHCEQ
jgi:hypothetical protein